MVAALPRALATRGACRYTGCQGRGSARGVLAAALTAGVLATGCSTAPFERTPDMAEELTPRDAVAAEAEPAGSMVIWGGRVLRTDHLAERTQLEVLAYPLDRGQRPLIQRRAQGRFLVDYPGLLETAEYAPGQPITIKGPLVELRTGRIGEQEITYPVVATKAVHRWRLPARRQEPYLRLGFGVMLSR